jgi:hypothetical protein
MIETTIQSAKNLIDSNPGAAAAAIALGVFIAAAYLIVSFYKIYTGAH